MFFVIGFAVNSTRDSGQKTSIFTKQLFIGSKAGENPKQLYLFQGGSSRWRDIRMSQDFRIVVCIPKSPILKFQVLRQS